MGGNEEMSFAHCWKVCQWLVAGWWFSPDTLVSSTNKTDHHDIAEILLKVALNTLTLTLNLVINEKKYCCLWLESTAIWTYLRNQYKINVVFELLSKLELIIVSENVLFGMIRNFTKSSHNI
jgi:hypothetical protein